jgi:hypothetical protein
MAYIFKNRKGYYKKLYLDSFRSTNIKNIGLSIVFGFLIYAILGFSIGNIFGIVPATTKWGWAIIYFVVMNFIFLNFTLFSQHVLHKLLIKDRQTNMIKGILLNFSMLFLPLLIILLLSVAYFGSWFNIQFLIPLVPLLLIACAIASVFYKKSPDILISVVTTSIFLTIVLVTLVNL